MKIPSFLPSAVVYQISLRSFTREGTLRAAEAMLPHVKTVGVDVVYLTPFVEMDTDMDRSGWSPRQIKSGFETPKNPYRISDYTKVDPEYGTEGDLVAFVAAAHGLGLKVFFDLVYLHCGPNNVIQKDIPDAFQRNEDGSVKTTVWRFPYINFASPAVREYLYANMTHFAKDVGCDGFRCDVGDEVPEDFWYEGLRRMQRLNPDFAMINEGSQPGHVQRAFHCNYGWNFSWGLRECATGTFKPGRSLVDTIAEQKAYEAKCPPEALELFFFENHDTANDEWENRIDRVLPVEAGNAILVGAFLRRGVAMLYNGNEIADNSLMSFFGPVEHPARARKTVDWARALQPAGQKRLALVRKLAELRHTVSAFAQGTMDYLATSAPEKSFAFQRTAPDGSRILVVVNLSNETRELAIPAFSDFEKAASAPALLAQDCAPDATGCFRAGPLSYWVSAPF